jgi:phosphoserine aminotransferase
MARKFNFSAGPAMLPTAVIERAQQEMLDWNGSGMSTMEMSHRGKEYMSIATKAEQDLRDVMVIPDNYKVLFLQGGASAQFAMIPLNLLGDKQSADYINTGMWSKKAVAEAKRYCTVNIAADTSGDGFTTVPTQAELKLNPDAAYVHYTPNETIGGVEFDYIPETNGVPLIADLSSTILSRPIDVSKFAMIYAGAQKNIGPAGLTIVIIRDDLLGKAADICPTMFNYATHAENDSMYNTPATYSWYMAGLVFEWIKEQGGLEAIGAINKRKADKLYAVIDGSDFYGSPVAINARSWMNVPFTLADPALDTAFLTGAAEKYLVTLKGHRSVGGMRASIYNAMPEEGVDALVAYMKEFESKQS